MGLSSTYNGSNESKMNVVRQKFHQCKSTSVRIIKLLGNPKHSLVKIHSKSSNFDEIFEFLIFFVVIWILVVIFIHDYRD